MKVNREIFKKFSLVYFLLIFMLFFFKEYLALESLFNFIYIIAWVPFLAFLVMKRSSVNIHVSLFYAAGFFLIFFVLSLASILFNLVSSDTFDGSWVYAQARLIAISIGIFLTILLARGVGLSSRSLVMAYIGSCFIFSVWFLLTQDFSFDTRFHEYGSINVYSLALAVSVCLLSIVKLPLIVKVGILTVLVLPIFAYSSSRSIMFIVSFYLFLSVFSLRSKISIRSFFALVFLSISSVVFYINFSTFFIFDRLSGQLQSRISSADYSDLRDELFYGGLKIISENPVFGVGLNQSRVYFLDILGVETYSHFNMVELWLSFGFLGFLIFHVAMIITFSICISHAVNSSTEAHKKSFLVAASALFSIFILGFSQSTFDSLPIYILLALIFNETLDRLE